MGVSTDQRPSSLTQTPHVTNTTKRRSRKRKATSDSVDAENVAKKPAVNFHSIADLMQSDAKEESPKHSSHFGDSPPSFSFPSPMYTPDSAPRVGHQRHRNTPDNILGLAQQRHPPTPDSILGLAHHPITPVTTSERSFRPISGTNIITPPNVERPPSLTPPSTPTLPDDPSEPKPKVADPKKPRTVYTAEQLAVLEQSFLQSQYPAWTVMEQLGRQLGVPELKVKVWFQNKRARWRRRGVDLSSGPRQHDTPTHQSATSSAVSPVLPSGEARVSPPFGVTPQQQQLPWPQFASPMMFPHNGFSPQNGLAHMNGLAGVFPYPVMTPIGPFHNPLPSPISPKSPESSPPQSRAHKRHTNRVTSS